MKSLNKTLAIIEETSVTGELSTSFIAMEIHKLVKKSVKRVDKLEERLEEALDLLARIRYCNWPRGSSEWLPSPEEFDKVLYEGEKAQTASKRG